MLRPTYRHPVERNRGRSATGGGAGRKPDSIALLCSAKPWQWHEPQPVRDRMSASHGFELTSMIMRTASSRMADVMASNISKPCDDIQQ